MVSVGLHQDDTGRITSSQIFISGFKEVGRVQAHVIFGDHFKDKEDYVEIYQIDLSQFNSRGRVISDWIASDKQD